MASFTTLTSHAILLSAENVDTDQIIPARFLKTLDKNGLGKQLFFDWRYLPDGSDNPDFALNKPEAQGAQIILAGDNFGCGSSREHAPWALMGWGIRAVISTSFADIFKGNSLKNGLLPIQVDAATHERLVKAVRENPKAQLAIDLAQCELTFPNGAQVGSGPHHNETAKFPIDGFAQHCLLNGIDQLGYILSFDDKIQAFEATR